MTAEYLAGLLDGEGTFQLQIQFRKTSGRFQINARVQIGFKHLPEEEILIKKIQKHFQAGGIYFTSGIVRFSTTNVDDTIKVCKFVYPYLQLKKEQCKKLLWVAELVKSKKSLRYIKGFKTTSFDIYSKEEMIKIVTISTTMNEGKQSGKYRNSRGRDTKYYIDKINEIYKKE